MAAIAIWLCVPASGQAQWLEPHRIRPGISAGFGGLHNWGMPSFDLTRHTTTLRVSPGLWYLSAGITQKIAFFRPKHRVDRPIILSFYYHNDWLLSNRKSLEFRKDQNVYMLMPGIHVNLDHRGMFYFEVSGGPMYVHERVMTQNKDLISRRDYWAPMGEIRIGGIFLDRKERVQQFPLKWKHKYEKQGKTRLKFKKK